MGRKFDDFEVTIEIQVRLDRRKDGDYEKYKCAGLIALCLGLAGCEFSESNLAMNNVKESGDSIAASEAEELAIELPVAHVEVQQYQSVHLIPQPSYDVELLVTYADGIPRERTLRLAHSADESGRGFALILLDENDDTVISITQRWGIDNDSTYRYFLHEATPHDALTLHAIVSDQHVVESYTYNGNAAEFDYVRSTPSQDSATIAFDEFYHDSQASTAQTLNNNEEGQMMIGLVVDTAFISWAFRSIRPAQEAGPLAKVSCDEICQTCSAASACTLVKCPFGGIGNPVCVACTGVGVACAITWVARFFL